jgi:hypothetical protein
MVEEPTCIVHYSTDIKKWVVPVSDFCLGCVGLFCRWSQRLGGGQQWSYDTVRSSSLSRPDNPDCTTESSGSTSTTDQGSVHVCIISCPYKHAVHRFFPTTVETALLTHICPRGWVNKAAGTEMWIPVFFCNWSILSNSWGPSGVTVTYDVTVRGLRCENTLVSPNSAYLLAPPTSTPWKQTTALNFPRCGIDSFALW